MKHELGEKEVSDVVQLHVMSFDREGVRWDK